MTENTSRLSDELLRRALSELAAGPDGSVLLTEVLRSVDSTSQVGRSVPGWRPTGLLLAAALLITVAIAAAVALSRPQPEPQPTPSAPAVLTDAITVTDFIVPFTYRLPPGETTEVAVRGTDTAAVTYSQDSSPNAESRRLQIFLVTGYVHACGTHNATIETEPSAFLEALRETIGVGLGPTSAATLGNLPAVTAEIDPTRNACPGIQLHEQGLGLRHWEWEPAFDYPGMLIVGRTGGTTIGVLISASTEDDLAEWLPIAQAYVHSFVFEVGTEG